jgi:hypothetical protein
MNVTRRSLEVNLCLQELKKQVTHVVKILRKRKEVTLVLPDSMPTVGKISSPCNGGTKKGGKEEVQRALAEVFIAAAKAVARKPRPPK